MKYRLIGFFVLFLLGVASTNAQSRFLTKQGHASFFSKAPLEDIEAHNYQVMSVIDLEDKNIAVSMLIKTFEFKKSLMQEHFNENYLESHKFPKATFKGSFESATPIEAMKNATYEVDITGVLTIHGVAKDVQTKGTITMKDGKMMATTNFKVALEDHDVKIPKLVVKNIAEVVDVDIQLNCEPYKT
ncbi:MAG: YceI family protein [Bacteroidota bacterium]